MLTDSRHAPGSDGTENHVVRIRKDYHANERQRMQKSHRNMSPAAFGGLYTIVINPIKISAMLFSLTRIFNGSETGMICFEQ
jgi:hypothetical protein